MFEMVEGTDTCVDTYTKYSDTFLIKVKHWRYPWGKKVHIGKKVFGNNCWALYVHIFYENKLFDTLKNCKEDDYDKGDEVYQDFHGGCTFFQPTKREIIIGCDYQRYDDPVYSNSQKLPDEIRADAEHIYNYFKELEENK